MQEKGTISIHTENIFPIIKKFLYSDNEIFLRELVSNSVDATQKIKRLATLGQYKGELGDLTIDVSFDKDNKWIKITDRGLGPAMEVLSLKLVREKGQKEVQKSRLISIVNLRNSLKNSNFREY